MSGLASMGRGQAVECGHFHITPDALPLSADHRQDEQSAAFRYSLVIATLHDDGELEECLGSLATLHAGPRFEVIVVDQNGDDRLVEVVRQYAVSLTIVHLQVAFRGASRARNQGAALARGEWIGFPDDDCKLLPDTLLEVECLSADPRVRVVTGQTVDAAGAPNLLRWKRKPGEFTTWTMFGRVTEATLFVRRDAFFAAGGFDERFGPGAMFPAAEGIDLMNRLLAVIGDGRACYSPRVRMQHPAKVPPWNRWVAARFHSYARGAGALVAKNPSPHMLYWGARIIVGSAVQALVFRGWRGAAFAARFRGFFSGLLEGLRVFRLQPQRS